MTDWVGAAQCERSLTYFRGPVQRAVAKVAQVIGDIGGEQLTRLAEVSQQPKVMIQVIPAEIGVHAGLGGAVSIADREGGPTIVHQDSFATPQTTSGAETVARVRQMSDMLRCEALPRGASQELIVKVLKDRWTT